MAERIPHVLVIKLGAIGDFILATGAFADIRAHCRHAHITLLTTKAMLPLAAGAPFFDAIALDERPKLWDLRGMLRLRQKLRGFDTVYDLQTNDRTKLYFRLAGKPEWCGHVAGCSHRQTRADRDHIHTLDRLKDQLEVAGIIPQHPYPDLSYAREDATPLLKKYGLKEGRYTVLIPGGAPHRPAKRWPHYADLAARLAGPKNKIVLVGGPAELALCQALADATGAVNLAGQTSLNELIDVLARAQYVVGNDTGPSHMAAAVGAKQVVLFGSDSDPTLCAPRGPHTKILRQATDIGAITVSDVIAALGLKGV